MIDASDLDELRLTPLPADVLALCVKLDAPLRLVAHRTLVHDVARKILKGVRRAWPALHVDEEAVAFGAATHDIGKALHRSELSAPGTEHEEAGVVLLVQAGFSVDRARFARTHGAWHDEGLLLEDLLVVLADTAWKAKRSKELDDRIVRLIARQTKQEPWAVFVKLDEIAGRVAEKAEQRLAWQAKYPA